MMEGHQEGPGVQGRVRERSGQGVKGGRERKGKVKWGGFFAITLE